MNAKEIVIEDSKKRLKELINVTDCRREWMKEDEKTIIALKEMIAELESE